MSVSPNLTTGAGPSLPPAQCLLDEFLDAVPDSVYFKDRGGRFIAVSRSKALRHGFADRSKIVGLTDFELFAQEHALRSQAEEAEIMRSGQPMLGKLHHLIWADGRQGWGLTTKLPLHDEHGAITGTFGVTRDVTELKRVEQDLERSQQELLHASHVAGMAEVATGVLHNVGNVLTSLNVAAELVRQRIMDRPLSKLEHVTKLLRANLGNLSQFLTEDPKGKLVLDYLDALASREATEQQHLEQEINAINQHVSHIAQIVAMQQNYATTLAVTEKLEPATVCDDAIQFVGASLTSRRLELIREYEPCGSIVAQKGKLLQILVNFLQNARNACVEALSESDHKVVRLRVESADAGVIFTVTDNGVGIAPDQLGRLFQHGFTTRKGGHGFGLHSCAVAAQQMGGKVTARSAGVGQGATFSLWLPLTVPDENTLLATAPSVPSVQYVTSRKV